MISAPEGRRRRRIAPAGLYLLMAGLLIGVLWDGGYSPGGKWTFSLLMIAAGVAELLTAGRRRVRLPAGFWLLGALTLLAAASLLWSVSPADSWRETAVLAGLLAAYFTAASQLRRRGAQELLAGWLAYSGVFASAWGVAAYIMRMEPYSGMADGVMRAGSTFGYANALSCFSLMALPVTGALLLLAPRRDRPLLSLAVSLEVAAVLLTYARFGYCLLLLIAAVLVVSGKKRGAAGEFALAFAAGLAAGVAAALGESAGRPLAGLAAVAALLAAAGLARALMDREAFTARRFAAAAGPLAFALPALLAIIAASGLRRVAWQRFGAGLGPASLLPHRLEIFAGALAAFRQRPLAGSGIGTFAISYQRYAEAGFSRFAHNLVLQMAVEAGVAGAALMAAFLLLTAAAATRLLAGAGALPRAFAAAALIFIAYNMFDWEWYFPALAGWFVVAVAAAAAPPGKEPRDRAR